MPVSKIIQLTKPGPKLFRFQFEYDIAFQPIFDLSRGQIWAYEALIRGPNGESAEDIIASIPASAIYAADQECRETAIALATELGMTERLSLNFLRGALLEKTDYIAATLDFAVQAGFPPDQIIFEFSESEQVDLVADARATVNRHNAQGFKTAMDDFGAGFQGLSLLCDVQPDIIKLDMSLIRNLDHDPRRQTIVGAVIEMCQTLGIETVVEGVETQAELECLLGLGVDYVQGYLLARPQIAQLLTQPEHDTAFSAANFTMKSAV